MIRNLTAESKDQFDADLKSAELEWRAEELARSIGAAVQSAPTERPGGRKLPKPPSWWGGAEMATASNMMAAESLKQRR